VKELSSYILEKIAAARKFGDAESEERELIRRVQQNDDPIAMAQLLMRYRGLINSVIAKTRLYDVVGEQTAGQMAQNAFINIVKNKADVKNLTSQPKTYIHSSLEGTLRNLKKDYSGGAARMSQALEGYKKVIDIAKNQLSRQTGKDPSTKEIYSYAKNVMGITAKDFTPDVINRIEDYKINEWQGSRQYGKSSANGNAEALSFEDVFGVSSKKPADLLKANNENQIVLEEINAFTQKTNERRYLKQVYKVGPYVGTTMSRNAIAINNGITNYNGQKLLTEFRKYLEKKGHI